MKDRLGQTLYVGKAKDLKKRVSTYFQTSRKQMIAQPKVQAMIDLIYDFDLIIVNSEAEALQRSPVRAAHRICGGTR